MDGRIYTLSLIMDGAPVESTRLNGHQLNALLRDWKFKFMEAVNDTQKVISQVETEGGVTLNLKDGLWSDDSSGSTDCQFEIL